MSFLYQRTASVTAAAGLPVDRPAGGVQHQGKGLQHSVALVLLLMGSSNQLSLKKQVWLLGGAHSLPSVDLL